jgi:hypothetical protein
MDARGDSSGVREKPGCVLGIAFGILLLGSLVAWLVLPKTEARDGAVLFQQWFASAPPAPYEVSDAGKLMGGEEVVKLVDSGAGEERPRIEPTSAKSSKETVRVDWARVEQGPAGRRPRTVTLVRYPEERARVELKRLFSEKLAPGRLDEIGSGGGRLVLEVGTLDLEGRNAAFVLEREFERGGTFRDIARVDLSKDGDALVVNAVWSRSEPFSKQALAALLAGLRRA